MKKLLASLLLATGLVFTLFPFFEKSVFANEEKEETIVYETVNPGDGFRYTLKRFREKLELLVLSPFPSKKADFYERLLKSRLAELKYVVDKKDPSTIEDSSQRYSATAGKLTELISQNKLSSYKEGVKKIFAEHLIKLEEFKKAYDPTTAEWRFVEYDIDYLKEYISQLSS